MLTTIPPYELWTDGFPRILNWEIIYENAFPAEELSWYPPSFIYKLEDSANIRFSDVSRTYLDFYQSNVDGIAYSDQSPVNYEVSLFNANGMLLSDQEHTIMDIVSDQINNFVLSTLEHANIDLVTDVIESLGLSDSSIWRVRIYTSVDSTLGLSVTVNSLLDINSVLTDELAFDPDQISNLDMHSELESTFNLIDSDEVSLHLYKTSSSAFAFSTFESVLLYTNCLVLSNLILSSSNNSNIELDLLTELVRIIFWDNQLSERNFYDFISTNNLNIDTYVNLANQGFNSIVANLLYLSSISSSNHEQVSDAIESFNLLSNTLSNIGFDSEVNIATIGLATSILQSIMFRQLMTSIFQLDLDILTNLNAVSISLEELNLADTLTSLMEMYSDSDDTINFDNNQNVSTIMYKTSDSSIQLTNEVSNDIMFFLHTKIGTIDFDGSTSTLLDINTIFNDELSLHLSIVSLCDLIANSIVHLSLNDSYSWLNEIDKELSIGINFQTSENSINVIMIVHKTTINFNSFSDFTIDINLININNIELKSQVLSNILVNAITSTNVNITDLHFILDDNYEVDFVIYRESIDKTIYSK